MKKLAILPVIIFSSLLNAQNDIPKINDPVINLILEILGSKTPTYSYDCELSLELGGNGLAQAIVSGDSDYLFSLLEKKGFGGVTIDEGGKDIRCTWGDLDGDGYTSLLIDGNWVRVEGRQKLANIWKKDLQKEFELAKGSEFEIIEISSDESGEDQEVKEIYEYYDSKNQKVRLSASFVNGQLYMISFSK
jgi:hypothetical protein